MAKETYSYGKRDLFIWPLLPQRLPYTPNCIAGKRVIYMAKEGYLCGKRGLCIWQKRPIHMAKETYSYGKRDLFIWQKRPIDLAKETY